MPIGAPGCPELALNVASTYTAVDQLRSKVQKYLSLQIGRLRGNEGWLTARVLMVLMASSSSFVYPMMDQVMDEWMSG